MELRCGGMGSQTVGRRMDGDCRDGGGGSKDAGSEDYENLPTSASLSTHMTAGAMAGIMEHMVMYPVDSVKVRREETLGISERRRERACVRGPRGRRSVQLRTVSTPAHATRGCESPGSSRLRRARRVSEEQREECAARARCSGLPTRAPFPRELAAWER